MPGKESRRFQPFTCQQMAGLMNTAAFPWWICGGHAIDLFLGYVTRIHADVEIGVLRVDQCVLYAELEAFEVHVAHQGSLRELSARERAVGIELPLHGLWCRPRGEEAWTFEVLLAEGTRDEWAFRRDTRVRRPLAEAVLRTHDEIPYLAPEIQLLFKAKPDARTGVRRPKDDLDFAAALPALSRERRSWLAATLEAVHPGHDWRSQLGEPGE